MIVEEIQIRIWAQRGGCNQESDYRQLFQLWFKSFVKFFDPSQIVMDVIDLIMGTNIYVVMIITMVFKEAHSIYFWWVYFEMANSD